MVVLCLVKTAAAELVPEDPYADDPVLTVKTPAVIQPAIVQPVIVQPAIVITDDSSIVAAPWIDAEPVVWEDHVHELAGGAFGLFLLGCLVCRCRRPRTVIESRHTQFQMSAIDPARAEHHVTAWERGPTILPTAIAPAMVVPRRARLAEGTAQPPILDPQPYVAPAPYPLTFPAFPEAANAVMLSPIESSQVSAVQPEPDYAIQFARGSQPTEHLEPIRMTLPHNAPTQIVRPPAPRRITMPLHAAPKRRE